MIFQVAEHKRMDNNDTTDDYNTSNDYDYYDHESDEDLSSSLE